MALKINIVLAFIAHGNEGKTKNDCNDISDIKANLETLVSQHSTMQKVDQKSNLAFIHVTYFHSLFLETFLIFSLGNVSNFLK